MTINPNFVRKQRPDSDMKCPNCHTELLDENVNIQTDVGRCVKCGNIFKISENIAGIDKKFDIKETPKGTWYIEGFDKTLIGASTRHWMAFFLIPFMIVWSGGALGGIYFSQIASGKFNLIMSLFGIPFLIGAIIFWSLALMAIWGKVELTFDRTEGKIFTGIGKLGFTKRFRWNEVTKIEERITARRTSSIVFEGRRRISFGSGLNEERKYYLVQALRRIHQQIR